MSACDTDPTPGGDRDAGPHVVIVGAGMAGLTAARRLRQLGVASTVVDKGRRPGGRMATRAMNGARFDHGAQHFSVRTPTFAGAVEAWTASDVAAVWFRSQSVSHPVLGHEPRHMGSDGMRGIPEHLAADLDVRLATSIDGFELTGTGLAALAGTEVVGEGSGVILTPPVPQTLGLLHASDIALPPEVDAMLASVTYNATLAVLAQLDGASGLPDGHLSPSSGPIACLPTTSRRESRRFPR